MSSMFLHSPPLVSDRVLKLQGMLRRRGWYHSAMDSIFGVHTAQAVHRGKYWLGYRKPDSVAGPEFMAILEGKKSPSVAMKARTALRKRRAHRHTGRNFKLLAEAKKYIGTKENPAGSNQVMFSKWYGMIGSWCAMFISYCANAVGYTQFQAHVRYAYVPYVVNDARAGRNGLVVTHYSDIRPGDLVCYDWDGDGLADHIGIFEEKITPNTFHAIEGNTAVGNDSNGGEVMRRERTLHDVEEFVRIAK